MKSTITRRIFKICACYWYWSRLSKYIPDQKMVLLMGLLVMGILVASSGVDPYSPFLFVFLPLGVYSFFSCVVSGFITLSEDTPVNATYSTTSTSGPLYFDR